MPSFLFIEEYSRVLQDSRGYDAQVTGNPIALHKIELDPNNPVRTLVDFNEHTVWVQMHADEDIYYKVGDETVEATEDDRLLRCGVMRPIYVDSGRFKRMSAIIRSDF